MKVVHRSNRRYGPNKGDPSDYDFDNAQSDVLHVAVFETETASNPPAIAIFFQK